MYDVIIIGGGVVGCAVARFLSRYQVKACLIERCEDLCCGTSKANSGIIHAGFDAVHGSRMAQLNVQGSRMMPELARELDIPFRRNGSLVVCLNQEDLPRLQALYENGVANGVEGLEIIGPQRLREMEPHISPEAVAALWAPTGGIVCPFLMTIALGENAYTNGVEFKLSTQVTALTPRQEGGWTVQTDRGAFAAAYVVNAAGVYADILHNMVSREKLHITPRRGDYCLLDKSAGGHVHSTIFQLPGKLGKGVLVTPTVHGNLLVGPTAMDIDDREGVNTTQAGLDVVLSKGANTVTGLPLRETITSFAGLRAHEDGHEFHVGPVPDAPGLIDCAGIESPGLSSAPAIGLEVAQLLRDALDLQEDPSYTPFRKGILDPMTLPPAEFSALVQKEPAYGQIICRCEHVTEGQILDAIRRPLGARSLDGVKRRVRAGMGRCQSGFCAPRVMEILARELGVSQSEITKSGGESRLIVGTVKDRRPGGGSDGAL